MIDLRNFSDRELSLRVLNDESLYNLFNSDFTALSELIDELFICTEKQHDELFMSWLMK